MSDITTYFNDNAQTALGRFVVYTLYNELAGNTVTNRSDRAYSLVYRSYSVDVGGETNSRWSVVGLIDAS